MLSDSPTSLPVTLHTAAVRLAAWGATALCVLSLACVGVSPSPPADPELAVPNAVEPAAQAGVQALLEQQRQAWNAGDLQAFVAGYWRSDQVVFASRDSVRLGATDLLARYRERYPDRAAMGTLAFDAPRLSSLGDGHVLAEGDWQLTRAGAPRAGRYLLVLRRIEGAWRIVLDYTTLTEGD